MEIIKVNQQTLSDYLISTNRIFTESELKYFASIQTKTNGHNINLYISLSTNIIVIKDDITKLNVEIIVNPANTNGLGCFQIDHKCLDNIIHRRAGPQLRDECRRVLNGESLETPKCIITNAYNLPCKYVIHVAGPNYYETNTLNYELLLKCYDNAIELSEKMQLHEIAFPCISTGLFGYPSDETSKIVINHLKKYKGNLRIILVCYDTENYNSYIKMSF